MSSSAVLPPALVDVVALHREMTEKFSGQEETLFSRASEAAQWWSRVGESSILALSLILYSVQRCWDRIPMELISAYGYSFYDWAATYVQKDVSTISNYLAVAGSFLSGDVKPPERISVPKRDSRGVAVGEEEVAWTPWDKKPSHLLLCARLAAQGKMTDQLWTMLADSRVGTRGVSYGDLAKVVQSRRLSDPDPFRFRCWVSGPMLIASEGGADHEVAELNLHDYQGGNTTVVKAIDMILRAVGAQLG